MPRATTATHSPRRVVGLCGGVFLPPYVFLFLFLPVHLGLCSRNFPIFVKRNLTQKRRRTKGTTGGCLVHRYTPTWMREFKGKRAGWKLVEHLAFFFPSFYRFPILFTISYILNGPPFIFYAHFVWISLLRQDSPSFSAHCSSRYSSSDLSKLRDTCTNKINIMRAREYKKICPSLQRPRTPSPHVTLRNCLFFVPPLLMFYVCFQRFCHYYNCNVVNTN